MSETRSRKKKKGDFDEAAELLSALNDLCTEKNINPDFLLNALETALITAYKRNFNSAQNVKVSIDKTTGQYKVFAQKEVVETVNPGTEQLYISLEDAQKLSGEYQLGDTVDIEVTPRNFGRVAAMNAKQVVTQKIREAEREQVYTNSTKILNDIIPGRIRRIDDDNRVFVEVEIEKEDGTETVEALLPFDEIPKSEQPPKQHYAPNMRIMVYVSEVRGGNKGTQVVVSRTHPNLVKKLFIREVPEILSGLVEIKSIAREAGSRTKIAVYSNDPDVDPQGACIGKNGMRVNQISDELRGEKIDIVKWSDKPIEYITASLSPATVLNVDINEDEKMAVVTVPENQQSLAIGAKGQNVRLAAKLTGWKIDIIKPDTGEEKEVDIDKDESVDFVEETEE
ncbi:MAG: transcription termination factor NusA [Clostridia bacterium]|nr:transcription termination factor NusA [Clostridia bacterium]